ncbi:MAG TPA: hydrolase [Gemmatimonadales bacterium]|nr:hydrolase [Gemmatimonadales bacterium]
MALNLNPATTALVLIDLQHGILAMNLAPHGRGTVVANAARLGHALAARGGTICLVHVGFSPDNRDRLLQPVDQPNPPPPPGGQPKEWSAFVPEIDALRKDVVVMKRNWGAFHGTELDLQLRRRGVHTIILCGVSTNIGVEQTAREAFQHNYAIVLAEDACASSSADMHAFSISKIMPRLTRVRPTAEIVAAIEG